MTKKRNRLCEKFNSQIKEEEEEENSKYVIFTEEEFESRENEITQNVRAQCFLQYQGEIQKLTMKLESLKKMLEKEKIILDE